MEKLKLKNKEMKNFYSKEKPNLNKQFKHADIQSKNDENTWKTNKSLKIEREHMLEERDKLQNIHYENLRKLDFKLKDTKNELKKMEARNFKYSLKKMKHRNEEIENRYGEISNKNRIKMRELRNKDTEKMHENKKKEISNKNKMIKLIDKEKEKLEKMHDNELKAKPIKRDLEHVKKSEDEALKVLLNLPQYNQQYNISYNNYIQSPPIIINPFLGQYNDFDYIYY